MSLYANKLFSFDIGTNSIGWCVFDTNDVGTPQKIADIGVRIFTDGRNPKLGTTLAAARREKRGPRRMRDRFVARRNALVQTMAALKLLPTSKTEFHDDLLKATSDKKAAGKVNNVYNLRARALTEQLSPYQIGRVFLHLSQRRGFKSNRITDKSAIGDNDPGKIEAGIRDLKAGLRDKTYGEWLADRYNNNQVVRLRRDSAAMTGDNKSPYAFYPQRSMLEEEFNAIWDAQAKFYPDILTQDHQTRLFNIIFWQRKLKQPEVGRCPFNPDEPRLAKSDPLFQECRIYQELNHIRVKNYGESEGRLLTLDERKILAKLLQQSAKVTFDKMRKALKLDTDHSFNLSANKRDFLEGNKTAALMRKKTLFGPQWADIPFEKQRKIIYLLATDEEKEHLIEELKKECPQLSEKQCSDLSDARLPDGYGRLGETACKKILEELKKEVIPYSKATENANLGLHNTGNGLDKLPKYQDIDIIARQIIPGQKEEDWQEKLKKDPSLYDKYMGRISNPTVHIALNQLRLVVNALLKKHCPNSKPRKMVLELGRDLNMTKIDKKELKDRQNKQKDQNRRAEDEMRKLGRLQGEYNRPSREDLLKYKLWEEMPVNDRRCIYSDKRIGISTLWESEIEVDHILPFSKTLDDRPQNKILCYREFNRMKSNRLTGESNQENLYAEAKRLFPDDKSWRFAGGAMERFKNESGFLARQLTDMQYITRLAMQYLSALYPTQEERYDSQSGVLFGEWFSKKYVFPVAGKLTAQLRHFWGLNSLLGGAKKNRDDHRHHAIDAAVIGLVTPSLVQKISHLAGEKEQRDKTGRTGRDIVVSAFTDALTWPNFRAELGKALETITVSHRMRHKVISTQEKRKNGHDQTGGELHEATYYGRRGEQTVKRKMFFDLSLTDLKNIHNRHLREALKEFLSHRISPNAIEAAFSDEKLSKEKKRLLKEENEGNNKKFLQALADFKKIEGRYKGIRHVFCDVSASAPIELRDKEGKVFTRLQGGNNFRYDIWEYQDERGNTIWKEDIVPMFDAAQPNSKILNRRPHPTAKKRLSLQQGDMVACTNTENKQRIIAEVKKMTNGRLYFRRHNEAAADVDHPNKEDSFQVFSAGANKLRELQCRQIRVDEIGQVRDPGPLSK